MRRTTLIKSNNPHLAGGEISVPSLIQKQKLLKSICTCVRPSQMIQNIYSSGALQMISHL